jgi:hypothetical protein
MKRRMAFVAVGAILALSATLLLSGCIFGTGILRVVNESSVTISQYYISPSSDTTWGSNQLSAPLTPGSSIDFTLQAGTYDLLAVYPDGFESPLYGVEIVAGQTEVITIGDKALEKGTAGGVGEWASRLVRLLLP